MPCLRPEHLFLVTDDTRTASSTPLQSRFHLGKQTIIGFHYITLLWTQTEGEIHVNCRTFTHPDLRDCRTRKVASRRFVGSFMDTSVEALPRGTGQYSYRNAHHESLRCLTTTLSLEFWDHKVTIMQRLSVYACIKHWRSNKLSVQILRPSRTAPSQHKKMRRNREQRRHYLSLGSETQRQRQ